MRAQKCGDDKTLGRRWLSSPMRFLCDWCGIIKKVISTLLSTICDEPNGIYLPASYLGGSCPPQSTLDQSSRLLPDRALVLGVVLLFGAIGLGLLGDLDLGKISSLPFTDNMRSSHGTSAEVRSTKSAVPFATA